MSDEKTGLKNRIESGKRIVIAEYAPPAGTDPQAVRSAAKMYAGKVHALGVSDNRKNVTMSALAAASLIASEGIEPILHMITRDRNRIALVSDFLGALALGIQNILCTSGSHQTLGNFRSAKNVFDIDSTQLLHTFTHLSEDSSIIGEEKITGAGSCCLGAVASPNADPLELQVMRVRGKVSAGAEFLITQPVFDLERFDGWWKEITRDSIQNDVAFIAGIRVLTDAEGAKAYAEKRPSPLVPDTVVERLSEKTDAADQRSEGITIALELIEKLSSVKGLRGFEISCDDDSATLEIIEKIED